jgi:hypothetical protein
MVNQKLSCDDRNYEMGRSIQLIPIYMYQDTTPT